MPDEIDNTADKLRDAAKKHAAKTDTTTGDVKVTTTWHGEGAVNHVVGSLSKRINAAGRYLVNFLREKLSIAYPPSSMPGEYPHRRTGHGRANVVQEHDPQICVSRVGTNVVYMKDHELGKMGQRRRPWLSMGMTECRPALKSIIESGAVP